MPILELYGMIFEWHDDKLAMVYQGRDISFEEACSVFLDVREITAQDTRYDYGEERFITVGMSIQSRLLTVVWAERDNIYRIITAFEPSKTQVERYKNAT